MLWFTRGNQLTVNNVAFEDIARFGYSFAASHIYHHGIRLQNVIMKYMELRISAILKML